MTLEWGALGHQFVKDLYARSRPGREYDQTETRCRIRDRIEQMIWLPVQPQQQTPSGLHLEQIIAAIGIQNVALVSVNTSLHLPDGPQDAAYALIGIEGTVNDGHCRMYLLDRAEGAVPTLVERDYAWTDGDPWRDNSQGMPIITVERLQVGDYITATVNEVTYELKVASRYTDKSKNPADGWTVLAHTRPGGIGLNLRNDTIAEHSVRIIAPF